MQPFYILTSKINKAIKTKTNKNKIKRITHQNQYVNVIKTVCEVYPLGEDEMNVIKSIVRHVFFFCSRFFLIFKFNRIE